MVPDSELLVLDRNILVSYMRGNALGRYIRTTYKLDSRSAPIVAIVTVGEIKSLAKKFNWGAQKENDLNQLLSKLHVVDISNSEVIERYAEIDHFLFSLKPSRRIGKNDMWIAAVASVANAYLLTTDQDCLPLHPQFLKVEWVDESVVSKITSELGSVPEIPLLVHSLRRSP